jgi:hypothetical protein
MVAIFSSCALCSPITKETVGTNEARGAGSQIEIWRRPLSLSFFLSVSLSLTLSLSLSLSLPSLSLLALSIFQLVASAKKIVSQRESWENVSDAAADFNRLDKHCS